MSKNKREETIRRFLSYILFVFLLMISSQAFAISLRLTGITLESGSSCGTSVHRFTTDTTWNGQPIDLLLTITDEDNDLANNCIQLNDGNILFVVKDNDGAGSREAWMNAVATVVLKNTITPVTVDRLIVTGFDLDDNGAGGSSTVDTDDMYLLNPSASYLSGNTNVTYTTGSYFGGQYNVKFKGQSPNNCNDSQSSPDPRCRASAIFTNTSQANFRVQNDDAYSHTGNQNAVRWFFASFLVENLDNLVNQDFDYGDAPNSYPSTRQQISAHLALGNGLVPDGEAANQASANADGDDTDAAGGSAIKFDDEDGVFLGGSDLGGQNLTAGTLVNMDIDTFGSGYLNAWIDWNADTNFDDLGEQVAINQNIVNTGEAIGGTTNTSASNAVTNTVLPVNVLSDAVYGSTIAARFKYTSNTNPGYSGNSADDGEVEDYLVTVIPAEPLNVGVPAVCSTEEITYAELQAGSYNTHTFVDSLRSMTFTKTSGYDSVGGISAPVNSAPVGWAPVSGIWMGSDDNYVPKDANAGLDGETYEIVFDDDVMQVQLSFAALNYNIDGDERIQIMSVNDGAGTDVTASSIFAFNNSGDVILDAGLRQIRGGPSYSAAGNDGGTLTIDRAAGIRKIVFKRVELDNDPRSAKSNPAANRSNGITLGPVKYCLPVGSASGTVLDQDGNPLQNVTIEVRDPVTGNLVNDANGNPLTTTTNGSGNYSFTDVLLGDYDIVETDPANYVSTADGDSSADGDINANTSQTDNKIPVTITAGKNDTDNDFVDQAVGIISGFVKDPDGNPVVGATVELQNPDGSPALDALGNPIPAVTVDPITGVYNFADIPIGTYKIVETNPANYVSTNETSDQTGDPANTSLTDDEIPVTVTIGENDNNNNFIDELEADLSITKEADEHGPELGEQVIYTITVTNNGQQMQQGYR